MSRLAMVALAALVPAAAKGATPPFDAGGMMVVPVCSDQGASVTISIPLTPGAPAPSQSECCVKGCHAGSSRKKNGSGKLQPN